MRKKIFGLVLAVCIMTAISTVYAQASEATLTKRLGVGGYGVGSFQKLSNFDTAYGAGAYLKYMPTDYIGLEASYDVQKWNFNSDVSGTTGSLNGNFLVTPLSFTAVLTCPMAKARFYPYIGGGADYIFINDEVSGKFTPGGNAKIKYNDTFGGHVSLGFDYALNQDKNWVLNFDAKYTWANPSAEASVEQGVLIVNDDTFDNLAMRMGLAYYF